MNNAVSLIDSRRDSEAFAERQELIRSRDWIEDQDLTAEEKAILDQRLATSVKTPIRDPRRTTERSSLAAIEAADRRHLRPAAVEDLVAASHGTSHATGLGEDLIEKFAASVALKKSMDCCTLRNREASLNGILPTSSSDFEFLVRL